MLYIIEYIFLPNKLVTFYLKADQSIAKLAISKVSNICYSWIIVQVIKNVFAVFFSGERAKSKILKICDAFGANRYSFSEDMSKQAQMMTEVLAWYYFSESSWIQSWWLYWLLNILYYSFLLF